MYFFLIKSSTIREWRDAVDYLESSPLRERLLIMMISEISADDSAVQVLSHYCTQTDRVLVSTGVSSLILLYHFNQLRWNVKCLYKYLASGGPARGYLVSRATPSRYHHLGARVPSQQLLQFCASDFAIPHEIGRLNSRDYYVVL